MGLFGSVVYKVALIYKVSYVMSYADFPNKMYEQAGDEHVWGVQYYNLTILQH